MIDVIDEGVGIHTTRQANIFQAFVQGDNDVARNHDGLGVGLSIARAAVESINGKISLESTPGVGTRVSLELPIDLRHHARLAA